MRVLRWSAAAALAAMVSVAPSFAGDDLSAMKASMDNMKMEMEAMRSQLNAEREALRSNAGGAPEGLLSAKGNATLRIGGDFRVQYSIGWNGGYGRMSPHHNRNYTGIRTTDAGWDLNRAELNFDIDLSCDTKGYIALRFENTQEEINALSVIDEAYWKWSNVGGSGLTLKAGIFDQPFGMKNNVEFGGWDYDSSDRALITNPFVSRFNTGIYNGYADIWGRDIYNTFNHDITNFGLLASYSWDDQIVLQAGIFGSEVVLGGPNAIGGYSGVNRHNETRNIGFVNHVINLSWNPCWLEGLHVEASYMGTFDTERGRLEKVVDPVYVGILDRDPFAQGWSENGDSGYSPSFDLGASYRINDAWAVYAEAAMDFHPAYRYGFGLAMTAGVEYKVTEQLSVGGEFDWMHVCVDGKSGEQEDTYGNLYRLTLGARYDFGNGIYVRGQYLHDFSYIYNKNFAENSIRPSDMIVLETGYTF